MKTVSQTCHHGAPSRVPDQETLLQRLRHWMNSSTPEERYLAAANDHADLERRMRAIERANPGPALVTFNH